MEKLLVHSCCGPCSSGVIEQIAKDYDVTFLFYNPNIFPKSEYELRAKEQVKYLQQLGVKVKVVKYNNNEFESKVKNLRTEKEGGDRCTECFYLRMMKTAKYAKKHGFEYFTTTLTVSPHKNSKVILSLGRQIESLVGVKFLDKDFKKNDGYKKSIENSKKYNIYRQDYCGCRYSIAKK